MTLQHSESKKTATLRKNNKSDPKHSKRDPKPDAPSLTCNTSMGSDDDA
jgi:hypothetical protein